MLSANPISLGNINTATNDSNSNSFVEFGGSYYFSANDGVSGFEVWKSDGTDAGTTLLKDINVVSTHANPANFTVFNGALYFRADDGVHGVELWKTDGTAAGTVMLKDIRPSGPSSSSAPSEFTVLGASLYFIANDGTNDEKLWKTDGTAAGTVLADATGGTNADNLLAVGSTLYFTKSTPASGVELYKSSGAGTITLVKEIRTGSSSSSPGNLTAIGSTLYFTANDGTSGGELWKSDGTSAGTVRVIDLHPSGNGVSGQLINYNGAIYFAGNNGVDAGLYKSTGTAAGTTRLQTIPGADSFVIAGGKLYFRGFGDTTGTEVWVSEGTAATTHIVKDINPGLPGASPASLVDFNGELAFSASDGVNGIGLWTSDGTEAGTTMVDVDFAFDGVSALAAVGSTLLFSGDSLAHGREFWKSDGTAAGTALVKDIASIEQAAGVLILGQVNGKAIFRANDSTHGTELWASDGTAAGTVLLKDINLGAEGSSPLNSVLLDANTLLFSAVDAINGGELWRTDGTEAGTVLVADINPGVVGSGPNGLVNLDGVVYFAANDGVNGVELWKTDGAAAGTQLVKNIHPTGNSSPTSLVASGGKLFFIAGDNVSGTELWVSDGTAAGTHVTRDITTGLATTNMGSLTALGDGIVFVANTSAEGAELWKSDGTEAGTVLLKDIFVGATASNPGGLKNIDGRVYFWATDAVNGRELWVTDGFTAGMITDLNPSGDSNPSNMTFYKGQVYFAANNGVTGEELYRTDGTAAGTTLVVDIVPGGSSTPVNYSVINGILYFSATDPVAGRELWQSDGSAAGTQRVADLNPGAASSGPSTPFSLKGAVVFIATTPETGATELWAIPRPLSVEVVEGDLIIVETVHWSGDNDLSIAFDALAQEIIVSVAAGPLVGLSGTTTASGAVRISLAEFAGGGIDVDLGGGGDQVTLDLSGGFFNVAAGMNFDGGDGVDRIVVIGSHAEEVDYLPVGAGEAQISVGLGIQTLELTAVSIDLAEVSSLESLRVASEGGADDYQLAVAKTGAAPATALLTGDSGGVGITALAVSLISALQIDLGVGDTTGDEDDSLTVTGAGLAAMELKQLLIATGTGSDDILAAADDFNVAELFELTGASVGLTNGLSLEGSMTFVVQGQVLGQVIAGNLVTVVAEASSMFGNGWSLRGVDVGGELVVGPWTVLLNSAALARLGALTTLDGGTLIANNGFALGDGDAIAGSGVLDGRLAAATGSSIIATGDLHLGKASSPAGFASDGELQVFDHLVTLVDANEAVLGSLTTLGTETDDGTLVAANGFLLGEGRNLSGRGAISGEFHNDGHVISTGTLVFDSLVSGVGDFSGDVTFNGGVSPGHSPASIELDGDVTLGASNSLHIELGGTQAGGQHDQLQIAGAAALDGTLSVTLINGFTPAAGHAFHVISSGGGVAGAFSATSLPALPEGLEWSVDYGASGVTLAVIDSGLAADFDTDGDVDGYDVLAWQRGLGISTGATKQDGDADNDSDVDANDLGAWTEQFGDEAAVVAASSSASSAALAPFSLPTGAWLEAPADKAAASDDGDAVERSFTEFAKAAAASAFDEFAPSDSTLAGDASLDTFSDNGDASDNATDEALADWQSLALAL